MRNRHLNKSHIVLNAKQTADDQCSSISLNNRFSVCNNADYFPESASKDTNCEQKTVCLYLAG